MPSRNAPARLSVYIWVAVVWTLSRCLHGRPRPLSAGWPCLDAELAAIAALPAGPSFFQRAMAAGPPGPSIPGRRPASYRGRKGSVDIDGVGRAEGGRIRPCG